MFADEALRGAGEVRVATGGAGVRRDDHRRVEAEVRDRAGATAEGAVRDGELPADSVEAVPEDDRGAPAGTGKKETNFLPFKKIFYFRRLRSAN